MRRWSTASGQFVLPGLIDVHVHYFEWMGELFLAHGVTTVKDVGNDVDWIATASDEIAGGAAVGPRIVFTGNGLDVPPPRRDHFIGIESDDMARRVVRLLHERGAIAIKVREMLPAALLRADRRRGPPPRHEGDRTSADDDGTRCARRRHRRARARQRHRAGDDAARHRARPRPARGRRHLRQVRGRTPFLFADRRAAGRRVGRRPRRRRRGADPHDVRMVADGDPAIAMPSPSRTPATPTTPISPTSPTRPGRSGRRRACIGSTTRAISPSCASAIARSRTC